MDEIKQQIQALDEARFAELRRWIFDDEVKRRESLPAVQEAQATVVKELQDAGKLPLPDALTQESQLPADTDDIDDVPAWVNPGVDHSAMYRLGDIVRHNGKVVRSTHNGLNHWEPGTLGLDGRIWEEVHLDKDEEEPAPPEDTDDEWEDEPWEPPAEEPPEFKQPTGAHDVYPKGARVTYNGQVYESLIDANAYNPDAYAQGWKQITT